MSKGKYSKNQSFNVRPLVLMLAVSLLIGATIGGTIAWLTASTQKVENTFTVGNINIELKETGTNATTVNGKVVDQKEFKMIPGNTLAKDPKVTVKAGSEACWVFVEVEKIGDPDKYLDYAIANGWTAGNSSTNGVPEGVYFREQSALTAEGASDQVYSVLANDQVTVKNTVTKTDMDALEADNAVLPKLSFTAYAVQKDNIANAAQAWEKVS